MSSPSEDPDERAAFFWVFFLCSGLLLKFKKYSSVRFLPSRVLDGGAPAAEKRHLKKPREKQRPVCCELFAVIGVNWVTLRTGETVPNWWRFSARWALNSGVTLKKILAPLGCFFLLLLFSKIFRLTQTKYHSTHCDKRAQPWFSRNPSTPPTNPTERCGRAA